MDSIGVPWVAGRGPAMQLRSGKMFHICDPRPCDIEIEDIAASLSKLCRYTGHCRSFYSVAQHSVLVSELVPPAYALEGLLHDATEAYLGDISRPTKVVLNVASGQAVAAIEAQLHEAIAERFGIPWPMHPEIKDADNVALATERRDLMVGESDWPNMPDPIKDTIVPMTPGEAELAFYGRFTELGG